MFTYTCVIVQCVRCSSVPWSLWLAGPWYSGTLGILGPSGWTQPAAESRKKLHELPYHPFYHHHFSIFTMVTVKLLSAKVVSFKIVDAASLEIRVV